jgi:hypothetical protein
VSSLQALALVCAIVQVGHSDRWLGVAAFVCVALDLLPDRLPRRRRPEVEQP